MKKIFTLVFAGALLLAASLPVAAAQYDAFSGAQVTTLNGGTNFVASLTTNTLIGVSGYRIDVPRGEYVVLYAKVTQLTGSATGTSNLLFTFSRCADTTLCETNRFHQWLVSGNGTTPNVSVTNIVMGGMPYLYLFTIENTNAVAWTNVTLSYGFKR